MCLFSQWDHRNGSGLTEWLASEYIGSKEFGLGNPNISVSSVLLLSCYKTFHHHHLLLATGLLHRRQLGRHQRRMEPRHRPKRRGLANQSARHRRQPHCRSVLARLLKCSAECQSFSSGQRSERNFPWAGLSKQDLEEVRGNWSRNMDAAQAAIVKGNGFNWQLLRGSHTPTNATCADDIRAACNASSYDQTRGEH